MTPYLPHPDKMSDKDKMILKVIFEEARDEKMTEGLFSVIVTDLISNLECFIEMTKQKGLTA